MIYQTEDSFEILMVNGHAAERGGPPPGMPAPAEDINPGTVEDIHKECKEVFPMPFEGAKLMVSKMLSNNFQVIFEFFKI